MIKAEEFTHELAWTLPSENLQILGDKTCALSNRIKKQDRRVL